MPLTPTTSTGVSPGDVVLLSPNSPSMFKPQQSTPPEESMAQAESYPTLTEVAPERVLVPPTPTTSTGVSELVVVLLPN